MSVPTRLSNQSIYVQSWDATKYWWGLLPTARWGFCRIKRTVWDVREDEDGQGALIGYVKTPRGKMWVIQYFPTDDWEKTIPPSYATESYSVNG